MKFCKDCRHLIDRRPAKSLLLLRDRSASDFDYLFCDLESGRHVVTGDFNYAHLERITGGCGKEGKLWEPKP